MALTAHTGWITFSDLWRMSFSSRWSHCLSGCGLLVLNLICITPLAAQSTTTNDHFLAQVTTKKAPPEPIDPASLTSIEEIQKLRQVSELKDLELPRPAQPADIQVFPKAIDWALRHEEIRNSTQRDALVRVTRQGLNRVAAAEKNKLPGWLPVDSMFWVMFRKSMNRSSPIRSGFPKVISRIALIDGHSKSCFMAGTMI